MDKLNKKHMRVALAEGRKNLSKLSGGPFGACIVKNGRVIASERNRVLDGDATAHAEINAIRKACSKLGRYDLSGCIIYSSTEPCPMCFSAIHWAKIGLIVYGTRIRDVKKLGFNELSISNARMKKAGRAAVRIIPGYLQQECRKLLADWDLLENKPLY